MKVIIAALTAAAILAGVPASASAASSEGYQAYEVKTQYAKKKKKRYRTTTNGDAHTQNWADKLPYGSSAWWRQMDREGRGGRMR